MPMNKTVLDFIKHDFLVWLRTGSNPPDFNQLRNQNGIVFPLLNLVYENTSNYAPRGL